MAITDATKRVAACRQGAAAVEFGLVLPIVLLAIFGVIEGGRLIYTQAALHFAAQEATRFAVVQQGIVTEESIQAFTVDRLMGIKASLADVAMVRESDPEVGACRYTVEISYAFMPFIPYTANEPISLSARSSGFVAFVPQSQSACEPTP